MIYRIRMNMPAHVPEQVPSPIDRWFITQIESRYGYLAAESLPLEWATLFSALRQRPSPN